MESRYSMSLAGDRRGDRGRVGRLRQPMPDLRTLYSRQSALTRRQQRGRAVRESGVVLGQHAR